MGYKSHCVAVLEIISVDVIRRVFRLRLECRYDRRLLRSAFLSITVLRSRVIPPPPPLSSRVVWSSWINLQLVLNQTWICVKYCKRRSAAALLPRPLQLRKIVLSCSCWEATSNTSTLKQLGHKRAICLFQHPASFMLSLDVFNGAQTKREKWRGWS